MFIGTRSWPQISASDLDLVTRQDNKVPIPQWRQLRQASRDRVSRSFGRLNQLGVNIVAVHASMHASSSCCPLSQCNLSHMWLGTLWQSTRAPWCTIARQLPGMLRSLIRSPLLPQLRRLTTAVPAAGTAPPPAGDAVASYSRATSALHWIMGLGIVGCIGTVQVVLMLLEAASA